MPIMTFEVTEEEKKMIEKAASRDSMSVSDFVRSSIYFELVHGGNLEALPLLAKRIRERTSKATQLLLRRLTKESGSIK